MKRLIGSALALALLGSTAAMAQSGPPASLQGHAVTQNGQPQGPQDRGSHDANQNASQNIHHEGNASWTRGDKAPRNTGNQTLVSNWRAHRLDRPKRGYHWVRYDNNSYALVRISDGMIANVVVRDGGMGNHRDWARGDRLPGNYGESRYAVSDWRAHNLRRPPRGYHWVRDDNNDFLLAAVATGVIADIVLQKN